MLRLLRWIQGYVIFEATGGFTERFLNLCKINNINLWRVKNDGVKVVAFTTSSEFKRLNIPAENSGMSISMVKENSLKLLILRHKWRFGIVLGAAFICIFIFLMSGRVWSVESIAIDGVKLENFTDRVEACGIKRGMKTDDIDYISVENRLLYNYSDIRWVSVNILGTKVQVEYTLLKKKTPSPDTEAFTNIVAGKSGEITLIQCYRGTPVVKRNAFVPKGTLLISGIVKNGDLSETPTHAAGKVFAKTENNYTAQSKTKFTSRITVNDKSHYSIDFFSVKVPLGRSKQSANFTESEIFLKGNSNTLPIGITRKDYILCEESEVSLSEKECKYLNLLDCVKEKRDNYTQAQFEKITYSSSNKNGELTLKQTIICVEDIALEQSGSVE